MLANSDNKNIFDQVYLLSNNYQESDSDSSNAEIDLHFALLKDDKTTRPKEKIL